MQLYTIQPETLYEKLLKEKELINNGEFLSDFGKDFCCKYEWITKQMRMHGIDQPHDAKYPFWAWYKYSTKSNRPDLRHTGHTIRGTKCVCLELAIPDKDVLLSNFDLWHCVLNDMPVFGETDWDSSYANYKTLSSDEQIKVKEKSWEKIFIDFSASPIQATFWQLNVQNVRNVRFFTAR